MEATSPLWSVNPMFGMLPQVPAAAATVELPLALAAAELAAAEDEVAAGADELDELDELDEHAVAEAASSSAPPTPSVSRAVLCLMQVSFYRGGAANSPGSTSLKLSFATSSFIGFAVPHWSWTIGSCMS